MIRITIEAPRKGGKTLAAQAITQALMRLGAEVHVRDEELTAMTAHDTREALAWEKPLLKGTIVQIDTFLPPGVQG